MDPFSQKRLLRVVEEHRHKTGQLPTFEDLERSAFSREMVKEALKLKLIVELYVTLTNGTIVKGFKLNVPE
jgi:hypothetical protein